MNLKWMIALILLFAFSAFLEKKFPRFCKRIEFPCIILLTIIASIYCGMLIYGVFDVLTSGVSTGDKVFFCIFIAAIVSIYIAIVVIEWKRWLKKRKKDN